MRDKLIEVITLAMPGSRLAECRENAIGVLAALEAAGYQVVSVEPPDELLMSMAIRYDHGLGCAGYYDQPSMQRDGVTHAIRLRSTLTTMRQLHEEVVGTGFYRPAQGKTDE